ncbi:MAG: insulinase family protein [Firmicutes bacterium]|nr:insulinase family protein [Bacillota bacterium]
MPTIKKLKTGVRLVMEYIPYVESCCLGIWAGAGAVSEDLRYSGISHFTEHMMFKGTEKRTAKDIASDIDRIGGQINAFTGKEATCYYVKSTSQNFFKAAEVLVDMIMNSTFSGAELDRERLVVMEEIKMYQDTPDEVAHETAGELLLKGNSLGNSILGKPATLARVNSRVMHEYVDSLYTMDNIVISVAGNFDEKEVISFFETEFSRPASKRPVACPVSAEYEPRFRSIVKDIEQTHICAVTPGVSQASKKYYAAHLLANLMGGSMGSRLFQRIREEKGLAYSVYASNNNFSNAGYFEIYAGVTTERAAEAVEAIKEELYLLGEKGVTEEELESSREQIKSAYVFSRESVSVHMLKNGRNLLLMGRLYSPEEVLAGYDSVDLKAIDRAVKMIADPSTYTAVSVSGKRFDVRRMMKK